MIKILQTTLLFSALILLGCKSTQSLQNDKNSDTVSEKQTSSLKQKKSELLGRTSKAICYSGFRDGQHPDRGDGAVIPSYEEILEDLEILQESGFNLIRLYDSGENSKMVLEVIRDHKLKIKVLLGIWLKAELSNHENCWWLHEPIPEEMLQLNREQNLLEIERGIDLAKEFKGIVVAISVGNEALVEWNDHLMDVDTVISYVNYVKKSIKQDVTVADNFKWWAVNGKELAAAVDFISVHVYPLWEGQGIENGLEYSIRNLEEVRDSLPDARMVITEAGWASIASEFGERASEENQKKHYEELMLWANNMNITTFWFEAFDENWKGDPGNMMGAEKHWGIYNADRTPKQVMKQYHLE